MLEGAKKQGIPADAIVKESAPAQFEVNRHHVADPIKACDYAVLLKRLIKNIAYDHEMDTTFMAKPYPGQAGNGLHVHISLLDKNGNNIFAKIGRASWRERVCQYVSISVVAGALKKKNRTQ